MNYIFTEKTSVTPKAKNHSAKYAHTRQKKHRDHKGVKGEVMKKKTDNE